MKYTSEEINIIIKAIKDYKIITGIVKVYKENDVDFKDFRKQLENITGFSLIREDKESCFIDNYYVTTGYIDFYYNNLILTINLEEKNNGKEVYTTYDLPGGIEVINDTGETIVNGIELEELEKIFHDYTWSRIENYVDNCNDLNNDYEWYKVETGDKEDLKQTMFESIWSVSCNDFEVKEEIDKLDNFIKIQENDKNKEYTKYDVDCMIYLALQIESIIYKNKNGFMIDTYSEEIKNIYEDYKKHDNKNKSLLDSINDYVYSHVTTIKEKLNKAFSDYWDL